MLLFILPVSGGALVSQLAMLQYTCECKIIPDIMMASSGGNVSAYIALASNWQWAAVKRIASELDHSMFIAPWSNLPGVSPITGYFNGDMYHQGSGVDEFFERHFTAESIMNTEIWTGTYNKTQQKAQYFCNRKDSMLDMNELNIEMLQCLPPVFSGGDIDLISKYSVASASIPALVQPQILFNENYVDGGVFGASPISGMYNLVGNEKTLHMIYFNANNLISPKTYTNNNMVDNMLHATSYLVRTQIIIDRLSCYDIIKEKGEVKVVNFPCNYENMLRVKELQSILNYSLLEIYPNDYYSVDIVTFNGNDVSNMIDTAYKDLTCQFHWVVCEGVEPSGYFSQ